MRSTYAPSPSFPSLPGDQYHYYPSSPVPASYNATPSSDADVISPATDPDRLIRDQAADREVTVQDTIEPEDGSTLAAKDSAQEEPHIALPSESASDLAKAEDDPDALVPPMRQPNDQ